MCGQAHTASPAHLPAALPWKARASTGNRRARGLGSFDPKGPPVANRRDSRRAVGGTESAGARSLLACLRRCRQLGIPPTRFVLTVHVDRQTTSLFEKTSASPQPGRELSRFRLDRMFRCSTSRFGTGQVADSNRTPLGLHRVGEKIGGGWPAGTVFRSRQAVGFAWKGMPDATITTRILWLEGLELGFNRGGNVDSHRRYIYVHGTGDETTLGRPASCGCVHLAANDLIPLFDRLPGGTLVWIDR